MIKNRCYMRTGLVPVFYCAAFIMPSLSYAADPVSVNEANRKIMYGTAAVRPTPDAFDLASRGMCYVATDTGTVTEWTGTAWITTATCPGSATTSTNNSAGQYADDADFTDGTSVGVLSQGVAEVASPTTVTEGDVGAVAITLNRALKSSLYTPNGQSAMDDTADAIVTVPDSTSGACSNADVDTIETLCSITVTGYDHCSVVFTVATAVLSDFNVDLANDATTFVTVATTATDYTAPQGHIYGASGDLTTAATSGTHFVEVDGLGGWDTLRLQAAGTSSAVTGTYRCTSE